MTAKRSALIVATSEYRDSRLATLQGPAHDAEALRTVLANKEIGGFDVRVALNSRVDSLRRTLESFFADRTREDLLLVHFSGHGLKDDDGQLYLAAADTQIDRLLSTGIDAAWVNKLMNRCRSERIALFLDCCFAGAFTSGMAHRGGDTAGVKEQFTGSGLFVIAASDAMQYSFEGGQQIGQPPEPSPFTKALVEGLRTGEADRDEDGHVSMNELFDFLEDRIRRTSPSQTPTKSAFNQVGDWVIAKSTRVPSVRLLPDELQRHLRSENPLDRFAALLDLRYLIEGSDRRLADAAMQAVERLGEDDSQRVAAAAKRLLDEAAARPRKAGRASRQPPPSTTAEVPPIPLAAAPPPPTAPPMSREAAPEAAVIGPQTASSAVPVPSIPLAEGEKFDVRVEPTTDLPWSLGRAASRAAIGSVLGVLIELLWYLALPENNWIVTSESYLSEAIKETGWMAVYFAIGAAIVVAIAEKLVPAVRVPYGAAYRFVDGNRWLASGILGAVAGLTVGLVVEAAVLGDEFGKPGSGLELVVCAAFGFVIAEAIVGRRFRAEGEEQHAPP